MDPAARVRKITLMASLVNCAPTAVPRNVGPPPISPMSRRKPQEGDRPSWGFLLLMGLIGGGPTFLGTAVGAQFTSDAMSVIFLTLAAGSILYGVIPPLRGGPTAGRQR